MKKRQFLAAALFSAAVMTFGTVSFGEAAKSLQIKEQGIFSAGGTVLHSPGTFDISHYYTSREGSTAHVDHANVLYEVPQKETGLPMVFLHGYGQSRTGWMATPDGKPGWADFFLRHGHSVYLIDEPRRGEAGATGKAGTMTTTPSDQTWYTQFRIGTYKNGAFTYNKDSKFPKGEAALNQFFRQMTPDTGMDNAAGEQAIDTDVVAKAVAAAIDEIYDRTGKKSILVTHSMGGTIGWRTPFRTDKVKAIIAFEPGGSPFIFPEGEVPEPVPTLYDPVKAQAMGVPLESFLALTKLPMVLFYGDHISDGTTDEIGPDKWRSEFMMAKEFVSCVNRHGGMAEIVHLPDLGIKGNTHFLMADKNNEVIAGLMADWLSAKGLS